jgi:dehydrogenase/reductase SDR family protein 12
MHPGWCDTPGVETSLPSFYANMKSNLRTLEQGADTIIWASLVDATELEKLKGVFLQDRQSVSTHLPLSSWTASTDDEVARFMSNMSEIKKRFE